MPGHEKVRLAGSTPYGQLLFVCPVTGVDVGVGDMVACVPLTTRRWLKAAQLQPSTGAKANSSSAPAGTSAIETVREYGAAPEQFSRPGMPATYPL